jgi:hypothetical protein
MTKVRSPAFAAVAVVLTCSRALAQDPPKTPVAPVTNTASSPTQESDEKAWSFSASAYTYILPDDRNYVQPSLAADRGWLHLGARYNYEDLETGSVWLGYNFGGGKKLSWEFTPMLGGVVGNTAGVAPGYMFSLGYWKLELASEGEFVIDARDTAESFFYNWSELSVSPVDWFRAGAVIQRTKVYQTDFDVQRGLLAGFSYKNVYFTTYVFNPDASRPIVVLAVDLTF